MVTPVGAADGIGTCALLPGLGAGEVEPAEAFAVELTHTLVEDEVERDGGRRGGDELGAEVGDVLGTLAVLVGPVTGTLSEDVEVLAGLGVVAGLEGGLGGDQVELGEFEDVVRTGAGGVRGTESLLVIVVRTVSHA